VPPPAPPPVGAIAPPYVVPPVEPPLGAVVVEPPEFEGVVVFLALPPQATAAVIKNAITIVFITSLLLGRITLA
jgi:hypothetical protein